ncbi:outer membrane beta-barrel protein [Robertkochia solimangrovi]|uniref:outer membrane beta-barrel protein n=1 Tax=Robertkochia solimangrovi TaxID=2213046 RepID=UPI001180CA74|nr:outer membrane beta-barrel protein [Robertkochia solimangrovi]TRZ46081.1 TonB-dependent receptor [Robertkochia solimangrovi]
MNHRCPAFTYLLLLFTIMLSAQEYKLSGTVLNEADNPLPFVNLLLTDRSAGTIIMGVSSEENGNFLFDGITAGKYVLKVSYMGYQDLDMDIDLDKDFHLSSLYLKQATMELDEVSVSYRQPSLEKKADRIIFKVENSTLSGLNAYDILKRTPGVLIIDGKFQVRGSVPTIYLNGNRVYISNDELQDLLQGYSGANIKEIEVITNPSSRYDAEGGIVLNIVTSANISIGYKGSVNAGMKNAVFPKYNFGTQHFYKTKNLNLFASYQYNPQKEYKHDLSYINFADPSIPSEDWNTDFTRVTRSYAHNIHTIADIDLSESSKLSFIANLQLSPGTTYENDAITRIYNDANDLNSYFTTDSYLERDRNNYNFGAEFSTALNDKGGTWETSLNYVYYTHEQTQDMLTLYFDSNDDPVQENLFYTDAWQQNNIVIAQSDISTSVGEISAEAGGKFSSINSDSTMDFGGPAVPDGAFDDDFNYDENIYAAYMSGTKGWESWSLRLGIRGEYTDVKANSLTLGEINTQEYFEIFPDLSLEYTLSPKHVLVLNYDRSIERPRYRSLNPFRYYMNESQFKVGNPYLTRSIQNKIALDYTYADQYFFSAYYTHRKNPLQSLIFQRNIEHIAYTAEINIKSDIQYSLDFQHYRSLTDWWFFVTYMSGFYLENEFQALESEPELATNSTFGYYGEITNILTLSKDQTFTGNVGLVYLSDYIEGSYYFQNQFSMNISLSKSFWNKRAQLNLDFNDIFNTYNVMYRTDYYNQQNGYIAKPESRTVFVGFRYNFGNFRLEDNQREKEIKELERLRAGDSN